MSAPRPSAEPGEAPGTRRPVSAEALAEFLAADDDLGGEARATSEGPTAPRVELLVFSIGTEDYALPVSSLREIVRPPPLSEVPRADPAILGVTLLRGEVVPVFDPRARLGQPGPAPTSGTSRVIIAGAPAGNVGLWVDVVRQVVRLPPSELEVPPTGIGGEPGVIATLGRVGGRLFGVLNLPSLVGLTRRSEP